MKTVKEWFETLPEPYKSQALENMNKDQAARIYLNIQEALNFGFKWSKTPQGSIYWHSLSNKLVEGKTIKDWLETLPEPHRTQALANMQPYGNRIMKESLIEALWAAFPFHKANEGGEYWDEFVLLLYNDRTDEHQ